MLSQECCRVRQILNRKHTIQVINTKPNLKQNKAKYKTLEESTQNLEQSLAVDCADCSSYLPLICHDVWAKV